jgi:hypothetical protein
MHLPPPIPDTAEALVKTQMARIERMLGVGDRLLDGIELEVGFGYRVDGVREGAYATVTKAMRYGMALQSRVFAGDICRPAPQRAKRHAERKALVTEAVHEIIAGEGHEGEAAERLIEALDTRLEREAPEDYDRPIGEMVAIVCQGLGLEPDWELLQDTDWAEDEIKTHPAGSPYAAWPRADLRLAKARSRVPLFAQTFEPPMTEAEWLAEFSYLKDPGGRPPGEEDP